MVTVKPNETSTARSPDRTTRNDDHREAIPEPPRTGHIHLSGSIRDPRRKRKSGSSPHGNEKCDPRHKHSAGGSRCHHNVAGQSHRLLIGVRPPSVMVMPIKV